MRSSNNNNKTPTRFSFPRWNLSRHHKRKASRAQEREDPRGSLSVGVLLFHNAPTMLFATLALVPPAPSSFSGAGRPRSALRKTLRTQRGRPVACRGAVR